jgi:hypothetical protein
MQNTSQISKDRMGLLNNSLAEIINQSKVTPIEAISVLRLLIVRLERSFEVSVMPKTIKRDK